MLKRNITVNMETEFEARPVAMLVQVAGRYSSSIYLEKDNKSVNVKSIMGMMTMVLKSGDEVTLTADGTDEEQAASAIEAYLNNK